MSLARPSDRFPTVLAGPLLLVLIVLESVPLGCRPVDEIAAPVVTFEDVLVRSYSGGIAELTLELSVKNVNGFELTLTELDGELLFGGVEVGRATWSGEVSCPKEEAARVRIPQRLTVGAGQDEIFGALIDRQEMSHVFHGEMKFARGVITRTFRVATDAHMGGVAGEALEDR